ncbi:MAG: hypothetical protein AAGJ37_17090, partial [Pseudomonadota bacterium]
WVQATESAAWPERTYVGATVFQGEMWIFGGGGIYAGVWHSTDGINWIEESDANFPSRNVYGFTVWDDKVWIAGGYSNGGYLSDLWVSEDGVIFSEVERTFGHFWFSRTRAELIGFKDRLWLMGGSRAGDFGDIHSTENGSDWRWHTFGPTGVPGRSEHQFISFNDHFYAFGGATYHVNHSIWRSGDGMAWEQTSEFAPFGRRDDIASVVFNDKLYVIGGRQTDGTGWQNDVWSTSDGLEWVQEAESTQFSPRGNHHLMVWNAQLWLIGGDAGANDNYAAEVWSSSDGVNWTQVSADAGFGERDNFHVHVLNNKLFIIGGDVFPDRFNDVWSTTDGVNWQQETDNVPFSSSSRFVYDSAVYNNQILLFGGNRFRDEPSHILSSTDGVNWQVVVDDVSIPRRVGMGLAVRDGQLWLNGGGFSDGLSFMLSDTWRTTDLTNWEVAFKRSVRFPDNE